MKTTLFITLTLLGTLANAKDYEHKTRYDDPAYYDRFYNGIDKNNGHELYAAPEVFATKTETRFQTTKGFGHGWRVGYAYHAPNKPYFSIEGSYSATPDLEWNFVEIKQEILPTPPCVNFTGTFYKQTITCDNYRKIYHLIENRDTNDNIFMFRGDAYYRKDLFTDEKYIDREGNKFICIDEKMIYSKSKKKNSRTLCNNKIRELIKNHPKPSFISFNDQEYYRIKHDTEKEKAPPKPPQGSGGTVSRTLADIQMKFGKNWTMNTLSMTPLIGLGYYVLDHEEKIRMDDPDLIKALNLSPEYRIMGKNHTFYGSLGAQCKLALTQNFDVGLNGHINSGLIYDYSTAPNNHPNLNDQIDFGILEYNLTVFGITGYEISVPFSWHVGKSARFSTEAEPYYEKVELGEDQTNFGARLKVGLGF